MRHVFPTREIPHLWEQAAKLERWLAGEAIWICLRGNQYLRVEGDQVVTTAGETYQRNGHSIHLGHYTIDSIAADGTLRAGCHVIQRSEIERFGAILDTIEVPSCP
jgi:hypothetical protein